MNIEDFRAFCLAKKAVTEELPFDEDTLVFKVGSKMFALCSIAEFEKGIALKCDPEKAVELRERYPNLVRPGFHMNKTHWNTVLPEAGIPDDLIRTLIDDSYFLVASKLSKAVKLDLDLQI